MITKMLVTVKMVMMIILIMELLRHTLVNSNSILHGVYRHADVDHSDSLVFQLAQIGIRIQHEHVRERRSHGRFFGLANRLEVFFL